MTRLREIPVERIRDGVNVRADDRREDLALIASIRRHGVLQPVTVRQVGSHFETVMGFRRVAACRVLGIETVPAVVETDVHEDQILRQVAENVDRRTMNPLDVARALAAHLEAHPGMTKQELAEACGRPGRAGQVWIANKLALLRLDEKLIARIESGEVKEHVAIKARPGLDDGRGRPRIIPLEAEEGRSRSIEIPLNGAAGGKGYQSASIGIDGETRHVDLVLEANGSRVFATLTIAEARLLGRRLGQAADAVEVAS